MRIETDRTASVIDENQQDGNEIPGLSSFANSISVGPSKPLSLCQCYVDSADVLMEAN